MAGKNRSARPNVSLSQRSSDGRTRAAENQILLKLPRSEFQTVFANLEFSTLPPRTILAEHGKPIENCYFLNKGVASIIHVMTDGRSVEVGLTGREGFIGLPVIVGFQTSPIRAVIQVEASGYKISAGHLEEILQSCPVLSKILQRYSQELSIQSIQIAACNRLHSVDQQLARWLLMSHDRVGEFTFLLTQEFISHMLGTRRASVSVAAGVLQKSGLITYTRGQVTIKDRGGLERASCECYEEISKQLRAWGKKKSQAIELKKVRGIEDDQ
jgi:CRP-like cAMP-binding protein